MKRFSDIPAIFRSALAERPHVSYRLNATLGRSVWRIRNEYKSA